METTLSTAGIPDGDREEYWRQVICRTFVELEVDHRGSRTYRGAVRTRSYGVLRATRISCDPMIATRSRDCLSHSEDDRYLLALQLRGRTVGIQDDREVELRAGDFTIFDTARSYSVDFQGDGFDHLVFHIPRTALDARGTLAADATARRIDGSLGMGWAVSGFLTNLQRVGEDASDVEREQLGEAGIDLLATTLRWAAGPSHGGGAGPQRSLMSIKQYVRSRLGDPLLTPHGVAAAFSISVRHLHRLFTEESATFSSWVRDERLMRCFECLGDPAYRHLSVQDIRVRYGFADAAVFSRAFKRQYGITPSERREHVRAAPEYL
ncbi:helix-turn-helix domain-containing protein [Gordonia desulfuricans]|uniref:Helix-turn-helix domain-containing protein n=1 Tax=Gordonia desulfuricans TaxID=89051 RepID=A0A7K3LWM4_9ACTN|nr:helix-turn-helix domain-containing protein [Gordonia desulfuricans]NDK92629.1 helix-turn-helix domain-containing protein [Gordonia desulfuricans]